MKEIYENVRNLREDNDLKQKDVADFLKMSRTTYNHYELGHSSFTADMIIELANLFKTTPNVLLNFNNSLEITDTDLVKLCKFVRDENINVDTVITLLSYARKLYL
ncbi:MAG: helix-turn-helix transcriptional regulator [Clostridia bacterium]|nr:helix-turn-helix transcriptional regulator [Clostridia bacterium]